MQDLTDKDPVEAQDPAVAVKDRSQLVSVIIPVYNAAALVVDTIESVLAQTHGVIEVIAVDDGSSDGSPELIREKFGNRVCVIEQKNQGPAKARNTGALHAVGEWLAFLDADDVWLPTKLAEQLKAATASGFDMVHTNVKSIGICSDMHDVRFQPDQNPAGDIFLQLVADNIVTCSSVMMRRSVFESLGGFDDFPGTEDWDLWLRYLAGGGKLAYCPEPLMEYRWMAESVSRNNKKMYQARCETVLRAFDTPRGRNLSDGEKEAVWARVHESSAWMASRTGDLNAVRWYLRSVRHGGGIMPAAKGIVRAVLNRVDPRGPVSRRGSE